MLGAAIAVRAVETPLQQPVVQAADAGQACGGTLRHPPAPYLRGAPALVHPLIPSRVPSSTPPGLSEPPPPLNHDSLHQTWDLIRQGERYPSLTSLIDEVLTEL